MLALIKQFLNHIQNTIKVVKLEISLNQKNPVKNIIILKLDTISKKP